MRKRLGKVWEGFTLVELVIVIAIVGILAAIAIPRFIDIRTQAYIGQRDGIVSAVRAGILTAAARSQAASADPATFPPNLEAAWGGVPGGALGLAGAPCVAANPCFELVVTGGVIEDGWKQTDAGGTTYTFDTTKVTGEDKVYTYTPATGRFE